jgi:hypothetical protein
MHGLLPCYLYTFMVWCLGTGEILPLPNPGVLKIHVWQKLAEDMLTHSVAGLIDSGIDVTESQNHKQGHHS